MRNRLKWLLAALVALAIVMIVVELTTDMNPIGATLRFLSQVLGTIVRFLWRGLVSGLSLFITGIREVTVLFFSRRAWAAASFATSIGLWYFLRVFLSDRNVKKLHGWREKFRLLKKKVSDRWGGLSVWKKIVITVILIYLQILLLPAVSRYVVVFPVRFITTIVTAIAKRLYGMLADTIIGTLYWKYFGRIHNRIARRARAVWIVRTLRGALRLIRLWNKTAWRLWVHDPRYRDKSGERRRSAIEPWRLWWKGELNIYIGRPLCAGPRKKKEESQ